LEELDIEFRSLGSTTYKTRQCFKVSQINVSTFKMRSAIRGKRLDLTVDPPPDLALMLRHALIKYLSSFGVPELWQFNRGNTN